MTFRHGFRNFLVGKRRIESNIDFKNAMLRGNMALIALIVGVSYIFIDISNGIYYSLPYYIAVIILSFITIALNRRNRFHLANLLFLITINALIFLFAASDIYRTGIYIFFVCISLSAFALMGFRRIRYAFLFSGMSLMLFLLSYWGNIRIMRPLANDEHTINIYFTVNFLIALVTCVLIVYSLIAINHQSEAQLLETARELKKSRERNEMVVESVNAGIYEWHPQEKVIYISPTWKKLLGYEEHDLNHMTMELYYALLHPDDFGVVETNIQLHLQSKKPYFNELRLRKKDGTYAWFLDCGNTKFDEHGKPLLTVGSIYDILDRKLGEEKILLQNSLLVKANKELDQFVYSVSHDLRAPLSSILGLTHVYELSEDVRERSSIVKLVRDRANMLDSFIREILDYSRNARTDLKLKVVKILPLVREVFESLQQMQGLDRIKVKIDISESLEVVTDRERIKVIVTNLISNAVKYCDPAKDSFIHIHATAVDKNWVLSVDDNGAGIEPEHLEKIFEMFYQAHEHAQGSGLGLYIASEAVQRLGGGISVKSVSGEGTTFTLTVPYQVDKSL